MYVVSRRQSGTKFLAQLPIKYIHAFRDRHGKTRHYFRRPGFKPVPLPGLPGSAEFMAAYQAALAGESAPRIEIGAAQSKSGSVAAAVALYLGSMAFGNLAQDTQRQRRRILDHFRQGYGHLSFRDLQRQHVEAILAKKIAAPHAARNFLKALRGLMPTAIPAGLGRRPKTACRRRDGSPRQKQGENKKLANPKESLAKMKATILKIKDHSIRLATPAGLEPATCRLEGGCSIQLSYGARRALRRSGEFGGVLLT